MSDELKKMELTETELEEVAGGAGSGSDSDKGESVVTYCPYCDREHSVATFTGKMPVSITMQGPDAHAYYCGNRIFYLVISRFGTATSRYYYSDTKQSICQFLG